MDFYIDNKEEEGKKIREAWVDFGHEHVLLCLCKEKGKVRKVSL